MAGSLTTPTMLHFFFLLFISTLISLYFSHSPLLHTLIPQYLVNLLNFTPSLHSLCSMVGWWIHTHLTPSPLGHPPFLTPPILLSSPYSLFPLISILNFFFTPPSSPSPWVGRLLFPYLLTSLTPQPVNPSPLTTLYPSSYLTLRHSLTSASYISPLPPTLPSPCQITMTHGRHIATHHWLHVTLLLHCSPSPYTTLPFPLVPPSSHTQTIF
jgi:hypothetical protein